MSPQKRKGRIIILLKSLGLVLICLSFFGVLSCNNAGSGSSSSSNSGGGTGTGWTITIQIGTNPIRLGETTSVMGIVKDRTGAPAPFGTNVCTTAVTNCFMQGAQCFATICQTTQNNLGQMIQTYSALISTGDDTIEVSSQGVIERKTITVTN